MQQNEEGERVKKTSWDLGTLMQRFLIPMAHADFDFVIHFQFPIVPKEKNKSAMVFGGTANTSL